MRLLLASSLLSLTALLGGCRPDDVDSKDSASEDADTDTDTDSDTDTDTDTDSDTDTDTDTDADADQTIVGSWLSEGDNVAPLLAAPPSRVTSVSAAFNSDGTYVSVVTNSAGSAELSGTYTVDTSTLPGTIVVTQTAPSSLTARGIWQVDGDTLRYEIVQDGVPCTAPTPETGFGSTTCSAGSVEAGDNTQVYVRQ